MRRCGAGWCARSAPAGITSCSSSVTSPTTHAPGPDGHSGSRDPALRLVARRPGGGRASRARRGRRHGHVVLRRRGGRERAGARVRRRCARVLRSGHARHPQPARRRSRRRLPPAAGTWRLRPGAQLHRRRALCRRFAPVWVHGSCGRSMDRSIPTCTAPPPHGPRSKPTSRTWGPTRRIARLPSRRCFWSRRGNGRICGSSSAARCTRASFTWRPNIYYVSHVPPQDHPAFFSSSRLTLNVTRAAMAAMGHCPSGRLFEAAACGAPILTDGGKVWTRSSNRGARSSSPTTPSTPSPHWPATTRTRRRVAAAARERTLDCHTAERRVLDLERAIEEACSRSECT